jgi:hypothetical protein
MNGKKWRLHLLEEMGIGPAYGNVVFDILERDRISA